MILWYWIELKINNMIILNWGSRFTGYLNHNFYGRLMFLEIIAGCWISKTPYMQDRTACWCISHDLMPTARPGWFQHRQTDRIHILDSYCLWSCYHIDIVPSTHLISVIVTIYRASPLHSRLFYCVELSSLHFDRQ